MPQYGQRVILANTGIQYPGDNVDSSGLDPRVREDDALSGGA